MLEKLKITNVALIKSLEIDFSSGFNVILGETGAGKSIIIDALNFVLGSKADKTLIRSGEETMKVVAVFSTSSNAVFKILTDFGIEDSSQIILQRTYNILGKGDCRINGEIVSVSMLKQLGEAIVDAYSQNESVALLKQKNHLPILDSYKSFKLSGVKGEINALCEEINKINKEIKSLGGNESNRERQIDLLTYQINEIENANFKENEDEELEETLKKLSHSEKIVGSISSSLQLLNHEQGAISLLRQAISGLKNVSSYDPKIEETVSQMEENLYNTIDFSENLSCLTEEYNFDEASLNKMIQRREELDSLKRKYGGSLKKVAEFLTSANQELNLLQNAKEILEEKEQQKNGLIKKLENKFKIQSEIRKTNAKEIEQKIESGLVELGILNAKFKVNFTCLANDLTNLETFNENIFEDVEFLFSANFGEDLKPLAKTISGGEMSRFMLVFKNIIANDNSSETLIFDEVDSGISGKTATAVANKIAKLSKQYQILCITHLPQVASMGDSFLFVSKANVDGRTITSIKPLSNEEVKEQISLLTYGSVDEEKLKLTANLLSENLIYKKNL